MLWPMTTEIERKWVVNDAPSEGDLGPGTSVRQGYLARDGDVEARIRFAGDEPTLTIKAGKGLERTEVEVSLPTADAEALWSHTDGRRIEKVRYRVPVGGFVAEVDLYAGALAGLCTVEVEFPSRAEAEAFEPPDWFGREVTGDGAWSNASLAERGAPFSR
jgi:CYTH domain-containing protein